MAKTTTRWGLSEVKCSEIVRAYVGEIGHNESSMPLLGAFIGIDKHLDHRARDLPGARRDATALWALFSDSVPKIQAKLLIDADATIEGMRQAFDETLGAAGPDDTVIISFSGHGTNDHRIVTHNTTLETLNQTAIPMSELATRFRESKAKAVLCILDCCFSGKAPARVFEESPVPRDPIASLSMIAGKGRILIAACSDNESAYEHPGGIHGLLTRALLQTLRSAAKPVSLAGTMDEVFKQVRADAARMGVDQTPVWFGSIEGGFTLPALKPGKHFYKAFPETLGAKVDHSFESFEPLGIPSEVREAWKERYPAGPNDLQIEAVNEQRVLEGTHLLVVAPTSSGKTFIGEMAAARAAAEGKKTVFLLPYRALVNEKYDQFSMLYQERVGMRVIRCTGDYLDQTDPFIRGKYDIALLTYEMFLGLAVRNPSVLHHLGLVVLDEAQFIADPNRGISVELLLTFLLAMRDKGIVPQIVALSAVVGEVNSFDAWLGAKKLITGKRPVPLVEGVLDRSGTFQYLDAQGKPQMQQLLPAGSIFVRKEKPGAQDMIVPLVQSLLRQNPDEKVIVFRNKKGSAQGCAGYLSKELGLPPATEAMAALPNHDLSSTSVALRSCMQGGTAFHSANLTREERLVVEHQFRDPESKVRAMGATTTVAAGINTPASTVILAEMEFVGDTIQPFTVAEYKNMAGRAGRLGFNEEGRAIILADTSHERMQLFQKYVMGALEPIQSSFHINELETWIIRLLAQVEHVPKADVVRLLVSTYGGYLANRMKPQWQQEIGEQLSKLLEKMIQLELVEQEGDTVHLSLLGRACGRSSMRFPSAMRLVELLRGIRPDLMTAENLMALLQVVPEADNGYTPVLKRGTAESVRQREATERYPTEIVRLLQRNAKDNFDYFGRCKRAAILWDWVQGLPIEEIEKRYSTNPYSGTIVSGDIRRFADNTRHNLRSAHEIATLIFIENPPDEKEVSNLLRRLEMGLPTEALELLSLPFTLPRGAYLALHNADIRTSGSFWAASAERIVGIIGDQFDSLIDKHRPTVQKTKTVPA